MTHDTIYAPLPRKSHTIRLLRLLPGKWSDPIDSHLLECPISDARDCYTTISYTWGTIDTAKPVLITCNGKRVPISQNLFTILRRLRQPDSAIQVWADAVCINQRDTSERTHQVGLMGEIYENSRETVIWLGEPTGVDDVGDRFLGSCVSYDDWTSLRKGGPPRISWKGDATDRRLLDTYLANRKRFTERASTAADYYNLADADTSNDVFGAFCLIQSFAEGTSGLTLQFLHEKRDQLPQPWSPCKSANSHMIGSMSSRVWAGLERLMSRPWWTRIWVIQETVLSRKATIHFGMLSAPWTMFADAAAHYARERHSLCLDLAGTFWGHNILTQFSNSVLQIDDTRHHHQSALNDVTLLSLLWKFRPSEATDKRDKVFALLGLATDWQGRVPISPNYKVDVGMVYLQTAISNIQTSGSLSVLAGDLDAALARKRLKGIPSWVMDWALPCLPLEIDRVDSLNMYDASGEQSGTVRLHHLHSILEVEGVYVDDVAAVGEVSRHTQITDTCAVIRQWNLLTRAVEEKNLRYPTGETYENAFWRTLIGDLVHTGALGDLQQEKATTYRRATASDADAFRAWRMWSRCISRDTISRTATFSQRDLDEGISSIHYALKTATAARRFFLTRKGYIGIGPKTTAPGDRLYVLKNSRVPYLLRPDSLRSCVGMDWTTLIAANDPGANLSGVCGEVHSCHRLVGDCFAYGWMDGEAFRNPHPHLRRLYLV